MPNYTQQPQRLPCALTIASSDSGGGAGLAADLKTFAAHRIFGLCAIGAVTAQNSREVTAMECLSPSLVTAQLAALEDDFNVCGIKIGLLGDAANTKAVVDFLSQHWPKVPVVLDPVMVSTSGHAFLAPEAIEALRELMARATVVTPNTFEAEILANHSIKSQEDRLIAGKLILKAGAKNVLLKGGHGPKEAADDLLITPYGETWFRAPRLDTPNSHGTGCTLSAALAANLAHGFSLAEAVILAKEYVTGGLKDSIIPGKGPGCLNHFHQYYTL